MDDLSLVAKTGLCFRAGKTGLRRLARKGGSSGQRGFYGFYPDARGKSLGIPWDQCFAGEVSKRHYLSIFHFNKEHLRRQHLGSMCIGKRNSFCLW